MILLMIWKLSRPTQISARMIVGGKKNIQSQIEKQFLKKFDAVNIYIYIEIYIEFRLSYN